MLFARDLRLCVWSNETAVDFGAAFFHSIPRGCWSLFPVASERILDAKKGLDGAGAESGADHFDGLSRPNKLSNSRRLLIIGHFRSRTRDAIIRRKLSSPSFRVGLSPNERWPAKSRGTKVLSAPGAPELARSRGCVRFSRGSWWWSDSFYRTGSDQPVQEQRGVCSRVPVRRATLPRVSSFLHPRSPSVSANPLARALS